MPMPIGTARAWGRLRDAFDLKGKHNLLLDEVVVPIVLVEDLSKDAPLGDLRAAHGGSGQGALAANVSQHQLFNPPGTGQMLELYRASFQSAVNVDWDSGPTVVALTVNQAGQWQDRRLTPASFPIGRMQSDRVAAATLLDPTRFMTLARAEFWLELDVFLPPGTGYMVESRTVNVTTNASFFWRERDLLPGE